MYTMDKHQHIAVIMLNTKFPRLLGDVGNPDTYQGRVKYYVIKNALVANVVHEQGVSSELLQQFIEVAKQAEKEGASVIITSCGFLASIQSLLTQSVSIPVISSSLILLPMLEKRYKPDGICIVTADSSKLNSYHMHDVSANVDKIILVGMQSQPLFRKIILQNNEYEDKEKMHHIIEKELTTVVEKTLRELPNIDVFLFECTNLIPYAKHIEQTTGRSVFHLNSLLKWL